MARDMWGYVGDSLWCDVCGGSGEVPCVNIKKHPVYLEEQSFCPRCDYPHNGLGDETMQCRNCGGGDLGIARGKYIDGPRPGPWTHAGGRHRAEG